MLNRSLFISRLVDVQQNLFIDYSSEYLLAEQLWKQVANDDEFAAKVRLSASAWVIPQWSDSLKSVIDCSNGLEQYCVIATDGSQIYPDRHTGTLCSLVNVGIIEAHYKLPYSSISMKSIPYITMIEDKDLYRATDIINCDRQEQELMHGFAESEKNKDDNPLVFVDGSLIFWHLEAIDSELYEKYLFRYLELLDQYYQQRIVIAGYISSPKNKELVNLLRLQLCNFDMGRQELACALSHVCDVHVVSSFVPKYSRTIVFAHQSKVVEKYPKYLRPCFFYLNIGDEVIRIEIPAWVANDAALVDRVAQITVDQVIKGCGYPVVLAEAHEQAVIKGIDRDFFYQSLLTLANKQKSHVTMSLKLSKKHIMNV